jgi:hypothetical protein
MKILVGFVFSAAALSQTHPALGGGAVSGVITRPLGGTYVSPVIGRPLGGVASPGSGKRAGSGSSRSGSRYVGPVYYVPNAYDASGYVAPPPDSVSVAQPMVVNNYFISPGSSVPGAPIPEATSAELRPQDDVPPPQPGDPLVEPTSYYLIAYKDHSMYSALAYWVEGDTLHYVTLQNTHNQASMNLIDLDQTYKLNSERSVPFSVPGK